MAGQPPRLRPPLAGIGGDRHRGDLLGATGPRDPVPALHRERQRRAGPGTNTAWDCTAWRGEWHTYTLEWSPSRIEVWVDGRSCLVNTSADPAFDKRYIVNLTAALGITNNTYAGGFPLPATMDVDYVRVWE